MRLAVLIALFIFSIELKAQAFKTQAIIEKADSILRRTVDEHLYKYYSYDVDSYYEYVKKNGKTSWESLVKKSYTKGQFVNCRIRFDFRHPDYYWLIGYTGISFDNNLILKDSLNFNFIPEFVREDKPNNFLSASEALKVATPVLEKNGIRKISFYLSFDLGQECYIWTISDSIHDEWDKYVEYVNVNAITGEIADQGEMTIGLIH